MRSKFTVQVDARRRDAADAGGSWCESDGKPRYEGDRLLALVAAGASGIIPLVSRNLPTGTVTFLFTDVEGSTKLLHKVGAERYASALAEHRRVLRAAFTAHGGVEVDTQGDAFFVAFPTAPGAIAAAREAEEALIAGPIQVRMGIHTGTPFVGEEGYIGPDVHRAARIAAAGHGGQVLVSAATAELVGSDRLRDLGHHRLKDLSGPERIYQLGDGEHPPLKTLHLTNLPVPATPFLGREAEVAEVSALLDRDGVRVVTLTGPGGTGKTRLALAVAGGLAERYTDGVWCVPLAPLRDPKLMLESAAQALGASGDLGEHIADKRLLLLLDNFEHLMDAADDLAPLLARCPNVCLLVTSREPLHISGEHEFAVDPLRESDAVELFLTRALAAKRDFVANGEVAQICERLDHLPLAIELAAARVKVLSLKALLQRLERRLPVLTGGARDLPERQRTLRATIEWSHELLTADEQRVFARLAVFRGGCTLDAAEAVTDADLDILTSLVDKSLIRVRGERFWMLETIREYAAERLEESGDADEVRRRHVGFFLALAEEAEPGLHATPKASLDLLEPEHDNVRTAFDELETIGEGIGALRLAGAMWRYWFWRGHFHEGLRLLERALLLDVAPTAARAKSLVGATALANAGTQSPAAKRWAEEAVAVYSILGDRWGAAYARLVLGGLLADAGDTDQAQILFLDSVQAFEELGDEHYLLLARSNLALGHEELGDPWAAGTLHQENLNRARAAGNRQIEWMSLIALGTMAGQEGRLKEAASMLSDAHTITRELGDRTAAAVELGRLAAILAGTRSAAAVGTRLLAKAEVVYQETGASIAASDARMNAHTIAALRRQLDGASFTRAWEAGQELGVDEATSLGVDALRRAVP